MRLLILYWIGYYNLLVVRMYSEDDAMEYPLEKNVFSHSVKSHSLRNQEKFIISCLIYKNFSNVVGFS